MAPPVQDITHYERLGVSCGADVDTVRQAFRRLSKAVHPDTTRLPARGRCPSVPVLRDAYEQLTDPGMRRLYDAALRERDHPPALKTPRFRSPTASVSVGLSGGEWLSLLLLLGALALCLLLPVWGWPGVVGWSFRCSRAGCSRSRLRRVLSNPGFRWHHSLRQKRRSTSTPSGALEVWWRRWVRLAVSKTPATGTGNSPNGGHGYVLIRKTLV